MGLWNGTTSTGAEVSALVFPSGETWAAYVVNNTLGVVQGTMNGTATDFNFSTGSIVNGTISGAANTKQNISGTVTTGGGSATSTASTMRRSNRRLAWRQPQGRTQARGRALERP